MFVAILLAALAPQRHRALSVEELAAGSPVAGVAVVGRISTRIDPETNAVYTDAALNFTEIWAGVPGPGFLLTQVGGSHAGRNSGVPGWNYRLVPGERIAVFASPWKGPYHVVKGMRQGLFHVDDPGDVVGDLDRGKPREERPRRTLDGLRGAVHGVLGKPPPSVPGFDGESPVPAARQDSPRPEVVRWWPAGVAILAFALVWKRRAARWFGLLLPGLLLPGYLPWTVDDTLGGPRIQWKSGSPAPPWDEATKTLTVRLNTRGFGAANLPSIAPAGAALQNAFRSIEDIEGASIRFRRGPDVSSLPASADGQVHVYFHTGPGSIDPFGNDLSGNFALTVPSYDGAGTVSDMDIVFNALAAEFTWSTVAPGAPIGTNDIETTLIHEALHAVGLLHPVYFYAAVWPVGRFPELAMVDRCYSPDDRAGIRLLYPESPFQGRITGRVTLGAGNVNRAIVVATDSSGVPQAAIHTEASGTYDLSVPAGVYAITAHHAFNSTYAGDISFGAATPFVSATTVPAAVAAGATTAGIDIAVAAGTASMKLTTLGVPGDLGTQVRFLAPGSVGTLRFAIRSSPAATFSAAAIGAVDLGPGITAVLSTVSPASGNTTHVDVDYVVSAVAASGLRTFTLLRTSGERLFLPAYHEVLGNGSLALAPGPANPGPATALTGSVDVPLLQVRLTAGAVEDVRIRRLAFTVAGSGPAAPDVRLWRDVNADGLVQAGLDERLLTSAAYALPVPESLLLPYDGGGTILFEGLSLSLAAGTSVDLLLTFDTPAAGSGDYTASLPATGFSDQAHGMYYGDILAPAGSATGGTRTLGSVGAGNLGQFEAPAGVVAIPPGGFTTQASIVLAGIVNASAGTVGLDVEVQPEGTPFTGTPTQGTAASFASGSTLSLTVPGLLNGTRYQWRARGVSSALGSGPWTSGGIFSRDASISGIGLPDQYDVLGAVLPAGGVSRGAMTFRAAVTNSDGLPMSLQVEVVPSGQAFVGVPTLSSAFVPAGSSASVSTAVIGDFRWQTRAISAFGAASAWVDFGANGTSMDFRIAAVPVLEGDGGCIAQVSGAPGLLLGIPALVGLLILGRKRKGMATLGMLVLMAMPAWADEEPLTLQGSLGVWVMDGSFEALGADLVARDLAGSGLATADLEVLLHVSESWKAGMALEVAAGGDLRMAGAGLLVEWELGPEHAVRLGVLVGVLDVDISGFGDFKPAWVPRAGYECRVGLGVGVTLRLGAELRYARFDFDEDTIVGDDGLGGFGALVYAGLGWTP